MLLFVITKYSTVLMIITILVIAETQRITLNFNILSFNNNTAGDNSLNNNGNAVESSSSARETSTKIKQTKKNKKDYDSSYDYDYYDEVSTRRTPCGSLSISCGRVVEYPTSESVEVIEVHISQKRDVSHISQKRDVSHISEKRDVGHVPIYRKYDVVDLPIFKKY
ncbi:unnamed protein product [Onchocerca flexuosa]|uniref:Secreted protein n=1 Tax=Onchocerca flexuosa TaxID=387005 RepID=A0A183HQ92_9BILA|nr:unnamed protein product [Onchocerca flexuosa]